MPTLWEPSSHLVLNEQWIRVNVRPEVESWNFSALHGYPPRVLRRIHETLASLISSPTARWVIGADRQSFGTVSHPVRLLPTITLGYPDLFSLNGLTEAAAPLLTPIHDEVCRHGTAQPHIEPCERRIAHIRAGTLELISAQSWRVSRNLFDSIHGHLLNSHGWSMDHPHSLYLQTAQESPGS